MDSQEDIFATQEPKKTKVRYEFLVLCDKGPEVKNPFALFPRSVFSEKEISDRWLDSILDHSSRLKSLNTLERLGNLSLFGKIDDGASMEEVDAKVKQLNIEFNQMRESGETQISTLLSLVAKNPYRLVSKSTKKVDQN